MTPLWVCREKQLPTKLALCIWGILQAPRKNFASSYPAKWADFQFLKGYIVAVFQKFIFASFVPLST